MKTLLIAAAAALLLACGAAQTRGDAPGDGAARTAAPTQTAKPTKTAPATLGCLATAAPAGAGWIGIEAPNMMGALEDAVVAQIVSSCSQRFLKCYQDELAAHSAFHGEIDLTYTIGPSGEVEVAVVGRDTNPADGVGPCVAAAMKAVRFPVASDTTNVEQTFRFAEVEPLTAPAPTVKKKKKTR
jgi:hypothetical protein